MTESLWNACDDYLAAQMLAALGSAGSYTTLKITSVQQWAQFDVPNFAKQTLPFGIISSYSGLSAPAGHSGTESIPTKNTYTVAAICVCEGTRAQATKDAKTMIWRMEKLFKTLRFQGVTSDDGSKASSVVRADNGAMFRPQVALWDKPSSQSDSVYGLGIVAFAVSGIAI